MKTKFMKSSFLILIFLMVFSIQGVHFEYDCNNCKTLFTSRNEVEFIAEYFSHKHCKVVVVFACTLQESIDILRAQISSTTVITKYDYFDADRFLLSLMFTPVHVMGVYVNNTCGLGKYILSKSSQLKLFNQDYIWLVVNNNSSKVNISTMVDEFQELNLRLDTELGLAVVNYSDSIKQVNAINSIALYDLYKIQPSIPIVVTSSGYWNEEDQLVITLTGTKITRRKDFQGVTIKGSSVVSQLDIEGLENEKIISLVEDAYYEPHLDVNNRFPFILSMNLIKMFNITFDITFHNDWGFLYINGQYDGMIGDVQRGIVDIGLSTIAMNQTRMHIMDFSYPVWTYRPIFIFLDTERFGTWEGLLMPFKKTVWASVVILVLIFVASLNIIKLNFSENRGLTVQMNLGRNQFPGLYKWFITWSETLLIVVAAFFSQGLISCSNRLSERILLLISLVVGMLLSIYYNSMIVKSLLQPSPSNVLTPEQLLESDYSIGTVNITYYMKYFQVSESLLAKRFYETKLKYTQNYFDPQDGVRLVKSSPFAYYSDDVAVYPIISQIYTNEEICRIREIQLIKPKHLMMPIKKNSPFRNHIINGYHMMRERGVINREKILWYKQKPQCTGFKVVPSIQLQTLTVAYIILLFGICLSSSILVLEIIIYNKNKITKKRRNKIHVRQQNF